MTYYKVKYKIYYTLQGLCSKILDKLNVKVILATREMQLNCKHKHTKWEENGFMGKNRRCLDCNRYHVPLEEKYNEEENI